MQVIERAREKPPAREQWETMEITIKITMLGTVGKSG
jgi:hypothetical protein